MNTASKLGGYALGLVAVFGAAAGIGAAVGPTATSAATSTAIPADHAGMSATTVAPAAGAAVTAYRNEHDKDLHLIAVRRDLSHFQHVHPVLDDQGTWSVPLDLTA